MTPQQLTITAYQAILPSQYEYAERLFLRAVDGLRPLASSDLHYALGLSGLGQVYLLQGRLEEAETVFRQALTHYERDFIDDAFGRFSTLCHLGSVKLAQGSLQESRFFYEQGLKVGEEDLMDQKIVLAHACLQGYADVLDQLSVVHEAQAIRNRIESILNSESRQSYDERADSKSKSS